MLVSPVPETPRAGTDLSGDAHLRVAVLGKAHTAEGNVLETRGKKAAVLEEMGDLEGQGRVERIAKAVPVLRAAAGRQGEEVTESRTDPRAAAAIGEQRRTCQPRVGVNAAPLSQAVAGVRAAATRASANITIGWGLRVHVGGSW